MKSLFKANRRGQRGQAIILVALAMVGLIGFLVLAIDGSKYFDQRRVTQNAADVSSLAGLYEYYKPTSAKTNAATLKQILIIAEQNGIPDSDGNAATTGNLTNTNVYAYWIASDGSYQCNSGTQPATTDVSTLATNCAGTLIDNSSNAKPTNAIGIKVRTMIPYTTFIGQMVGQRNLQAQAEGVAILRVGTHSVGDSGQSVWAGGGQCNSLGNPAISFGTEGVTNGTDFFGGLFVNGSMYEGGKNVKVFNTKGKGDISIVDGMPTNGPAESGKEYNYVTNAAAPDPAMHPWAYITVNGVKTQIQAYHFRPTSPYVSGAPATVPTDQPNTIFEEWRTSAGATPNFYHYINAGSAAANRAKLLQSYSSGDRGIFFVDGDVDIDGNFTRGATIIATGKVTLSSAGASGTGITWGDTKDGEDANNLTSPVWSYGISILAGGSPAVAANKCAVTGNTEPIFQMDGNQAHWSGILYVPNGNVAIGFNGNNGKNGTKGPIIAYSVTMGAEGTNSNSMNFGTCSVCFVHPTTLTELTQ